MAPRGQVNFVAPTDSPGLINEIWNKQSSQMSHRIGVYEMKPSGPEISEKGLILLQLIAPFIGAPRSTPSDTLFPMYFDSPIDDRRLIGVWAGMGVGTEN